MLFFFLLNECVSIRLTIKHSLRKKKERSHGSKRHGIQCGGLLSFVWRWQVSPQGLAIIAATPREGKKSTSTNTGFPFSLRKV
jgi:hypothetical protein